MKYNIMFRSTDGAGFIRNKRAWSSQVDPMLDPVAEFDADKVDAEVKRLQQQADAAGNDRGERYFKVVRR